MKIKIMTLFLLTPFISYSQKEDNIWLIGRNFEPDSLDATSVIDFRESPPLMDLVYEFPGFYETNANISDPDGNLLFYTNGVHLYNAAYNLVENGGAFQSPTLYPGGYVFIQGALIFPYPGHPGQYMFILCDDTNYTKNNGFIIHGCYPITYSVIESNGNGGTVTSKKIPFSSDTLHFNQLQGIKHANGRDWWLVSAPFFGTNRFNKFLLSPEGIAPYDADYFNGPYFKSWGQGAVSPNGERVAYYDVYFEEDFSGGLNIDLFRFDRCSGQLSDHVQMVYPEEGATGGIAFSPDSKVLYVSDRFEIYQYDLDATDIMASRLQVAEFDGFLDEWGAPSRFGLMKLAPDGKIYICSTTLGTQYMHVIEQPNVLGIGCNVQQHSFILPTRNRRSLPHHPTYRLGPVEGSPCDTLDFTPISEANMERVVSIFPNPITKGEDVNIALNLPVPHVAVINFYDALGERVLQEELPINGHYSLSLNGLAAGIYFYEIVSEGQRIGEGKLVVGR